MKEIQYEIVKEIAVLSKGDSGYTNGWAIRQIHLTESCFVWRLTTHYHKVLLTLKNC